MANKDIKGKIKIATSVVSTGYLEVSIDSGSTFTVVDTINIPINSTPTVYSFPNYANVDVDNPAVEVRIRIQKQITTSSTTTTTTTIITTTSTTTSTTTKPTTTTTSSSTTTLPTTSTSTTTSTTIPGSSSFTKVSGWNTAATAQAGWLYLPAGYDASGVTKYRFIVFLHGQGEIGNGSAAADVLITSGKGPGEYFAAGDKPANIVYFIPQLASSPGTWEPNWVEAARSFIVNNYNGDPNLFGLCGLSLGGSGTSKYVMTYPDRVSAYLISTGDTQYQRNGAEGTTVNGIRQADVPGWFLAGTADGTISVNNGIQSMTALNNLSPKPTYPFLIDTFWGKDHNAALWSTEVYNRKNKTTGGGTASFDYIDDWFRRFKINDLLYNSTNYVIVAETSNDWTDYRMALRLVNKLTSGTDKTNLLARLSTVKSNIESSWRVLELNYGATAATGNINNINKTNISMPTTNLIDVNGVATSIGFDLIQQKWTPPSVNNSLDLNNEYYGLPVECFKNAYRVYDTTNSNTWRWTGLNDSKNYKLRIIYGNISQINTTHYAINVTINSVTTLLDNEMDNTHKYVDINATSTSGVLNVGLNSLISGGEENIYFITLFESVTGGTTTSSTTTTTTTLNPTTTTTSTTKPTTTSSTTTTTTTSGPTTSTSSTTTTSTTVVPPTGIAKFSFAPTSNTYTEPGWVYINGNPATTDLSGTQNGYTITNVQANWQNIGAIGGDVDGGMSTGTFANFPANVVRGNWLNYTKVWANPSSYNLIISGLNQSKQYNIEILGSIKSSLQPVNVTTYRCVGNGDEWNPTMLTLDNVDNSSNSITFSSITPDTNSQIRLSVNQTAGSGNYGYISGIIIAEVALEAKFNFNATAQNVSGWNDMTGSPHLSLISKTDSSTGVTVSNIFSAGKWADFGGSTASDVAGGTGVSAVFPANVLVSYWFNAFSTYSSNGANMKISNLTPNTSYQLKMIGSRSSTNAGGIPAGQNRLMNFYVSQVATTGHASEQSRLDYPAKDSVITQTFTIISNSSGEIYVGIYQSSTGDSTNGNQFGYLNGLTVIKSGSPTSTTTTTTTTIGSTTSSTTTTTTTATPGTGDTAYFNFNLSAQSTPGWKDVSGSPGAGVITATDNINGTNYTVSSISGKWGTFGGSSSNIDGGTGTNSDFPANVLVSNWYNYSYVYLSYGPNIKISNLTPNTSYQLKMIGSRSSVTNGGIPVGQNRIMEFWVTSSSVIGDPSEQSNTTYAARDSNTTQTFAITSNSSGELYLGIYQSSAGNETNGDQIGYLNGLIIKKL